jgi:dTDP-4-amino-4,6-dideoxygalactose transaminase
MPPLLEWASQHDLNVVEDAACGFGAHSLGQHVGTFGDFGCFSFHPRKAITTGEGGMLLTQDAGLAELCRSLRDHGASKSDLSRHQGKAAFLLSEFNHLGFNYRMTDLQGAVGVAQMQKAAWIQQQRTARAKRYGQLLSPLPWLQPPQVPADMQHGFQSYVCLFAPEHPTPQNAGRLNEMRNQLMLRLENLGISTRQGTHAVTTLGYYQNKYGIRDEDFPGALLADRLSLTLPLYAQMTDSEQDYVVENLEQVFKELPCAGL